MTHSRKLGALLALTACLVPTTRAQSFDYADFGSTAGLNLVGLTAQSGNLLRLQDNLAPPVSGDNRGAAWHAAPVQVAGGFDTTFVYNMNSPSTTGGSDGFAFVVQNDQVASTAPIVNGGPDGQGNTAIGRHAAAAGFGRFATWSPGDAIDNSIAIHFDTYTNGNWGDANSNHISVHTQGSADNLQDESASIGRTGFLATDLNDGADHTVRVLYVPGNLEVYLDGVLELSVAYDFNTGGTLVDSSSPIGGLTLINGHSAYVGFTSGAGSARENRDLVSWSFGSTADNSGASDCDCLGANGPCFNASGAGRGCPNSNPNGLGAMLVGSGDAVISADTFGLAVADAAPSKPGLILSGTASLGPNGVATVPDSAGLLCVGGATRRGGVVLTDAAGTASFPDFQGAAYGASDIVGAGASISYTFWFRDPGTAAGCLNDTASSDFNFSNGWTVTWQ